MAETDGPRTPGETNVRTYLPICDFGAEAGAFVRPGLPRRFVVWATVLAFFCTYLPGCTSWRVVSLIEADLERENLVGKRVRITAPPEDVIIMKVDELNYPYVLGTPPAPGGREGDRGISVNLLIVHRMEVEEFDGWKTSGVVVASVVGGVMITFGVALMIFIGTY